MCTWPTTTTEKVLIKGGLSIAADKLNGIRPWITFPFAMFAPLEHGANNTSFFVVGVVVPRRPLYIEPAYV